MNKIYMFILAAVATLTMASCEKVSPIGVLVSGTGVEDRIKMSNLYYQQHKADYLMGIADEGDYRLNLILPTLHPYAIWEALKTAS